MHLSRSIVTLISYQVELAFSTNLESSNIAFHIICWLDLLHARVLPLCYYLHSRSRCCILLLLYSYEV